LFAALVFAASRDRADHDWFSDRYVADRRVILVRLSCLPVRQEQGGPVVTSAEGSYTVLERGGHVVEVSMSSFKTQPGVKVSGGDRVAVEGAVLEVGGQTETVTVSAESPVIQAATGGDRASSSRSSSTCRGTVTTSEFLSFP
jgi:hypothetical protein